MSAITDAIVANANNAVAANESLSSMMSCDKGNSGTAGTGISTAGTALIDCLTTFGFIPRIVRFDVAGNFGFQTLDGNPHVIAVDAKTELSARFIKAIYPASYATAGLRTTATGVHVF